MLFIKRCIWLNSRIFKGCSIFFSFLVPQDIVLYGTYLAAQQQYKLMQFPVCGNVGVLFSLEILVQASEKHIQTQFSLWQFSVLEYYTARNVMSCFSAICLRRN